MNHLLSILRLENKLTQSRLKQLYRILSKKTHPDSENGSDEQFIHLKKEYEEAMDVLSDQDKKNTFLKRNEFKQDPNIRTKILKYLYLYSIKIFSKEAEAILLQLIQFSKSYKQDIYDLLRSYHKSLYCTYHQWLSNEKIYYSHNLFISSVKQLYYYYEFSLPRHKTLLYTYAEELGQKAAKLDKVISNTLIGMMDWLKEESKQIK
jgi:curved DNA-binding protein CbpA